MLYAPEYYKDFKCIADKCTHSCCIGWEIDVDEYTLDKYAILSDARILQSIDNEPSPHFRLCDKDRCPHLDEQGLCKIISEHGEGYLCDICREHPRFYNETVRGLEVGLGMACEEACRIILSSDDYDTITLISKEEDGCIVDFDAIPHRERIFDILKDIFLCYSYKLYKISVLFDTSLSTLSDDSWRGLLDGLEYLDESHRDMFSCYSSTVSTDADSENETYLQRALAYFIYRHVTAAKDENDLRGRLGLCLFCERLLCSIISYTDTDAFTAARTISEEIEYSEDNTQAIINVFKQ